eukprot:gene11245-21434_t
MADMSAFFIFLSSLTLHATTVNSISAEENRLANYLLNSTRYSPEVRPVLKYDEKVIVRHGLTLAHLIKLDEKSQIITTRVIIKMKWYDVRLKWDPALYNGITEFNIDVSLIWVPQVELFNNADDSLDTIAVPRAIVKYNGTVTAVFPRILKSTCPITVKDFPFDQQVCELRFGSFQFDTLHMDVLPLSKNVISKQGLTKFQENGEWLVGDTRVVYGSVYHAFSNTTEFAQMSYKLVLRRKPLYYIVNFMIPCALIALITILLFLIPADTGEQMAVAITILLSMAVFFLLLEEKMPETSDHVPLIGKYFACTIVEISLAVWATCMMLCFHHHEPTEVPVWMKKYILVKLATLLRIKTSENELQTKSRRGTVLQRLTKSNKTTRRTDNFATEIGRSHLLIWQAKAKAKRLRREKAVKEELSRDTLLTNLSEDSPVRTIKSREDLKDNGAMAGGRKESKETGTKREKSEEKKEKKRHKEKEKKEKGTVSDKHERQGNDIAMDMGKTEGEMERKKRRSKESRSDKNEGKSSNEKGHREDKESNRNKEGDKVKKSSKDNGEKRNDSKKARNEKENKQTNDKSNDEKCSEKNRDDKDKAERRKEKHALKKEKHENAEKKTEEMKEKHDVESTVKRENKEKRNKENRGKPEAEKKSKEDQKIANESKKRDRSKSKEVDRKDNKGKEHTTSKESKYEKKDEEKERSKVSTSSKKANSETEKEHKGTSKKDAQKDDLRKEDVAKRTSKDDEVRPEKNGKWIKFKNEENDKEDNAMEEKKAVEKGTNSTTGQTIMNRKDQELEVNEIDDEGNGAVEVLQLGGTRSQENKSVKNGNENKIDDKDSETEDLEGCENELRQKVETDTMKPSDVAKGKVAKEEAATDIGSSGSIHSCDDDTRILIPSAKQPSSSIKPNVVKQFKLVDRVMRVTESLTQRLNKSKTIAKQDPLVPPPPTAKQLTAKKLGNAVDWEEAEHESVKLMAHTIQEKEADNELKTKWKEVGKVINTLLMWVYIASIFLTFFALFGPVFAADEMEIN